MIDALIGGRIHGQPAERESGNGNSYVTAKVRVPMRTGETIFANVITFEPEAMRSLLALTDKDGVALSGEVTLKVWIDKEGTAKPVLDFLAHAVLTEYHVSRKRQSVREGDPHG